MNKNTPKYSQSELPAIELFQKLGYDYIKNYPRESINEVVTDRIDLVIIFLIAYIA